MDDLRHREHGGGRHRIHRRQPSPLHRLLIPRHRRQPHWRLAPLPAVLPHDDVARDAARQTADCARAEFER